MFTVKGKSATSNEWHILMETDNPIDAVEFGLRVKGYAQTMVFEDGEAIPSTLAI